MASSNRFCNVPLILLIVLILLFYNELMVLGLRVYVAFTESPKSELLLGEYYKSTSSLNNSYGDRFYAEAFESLKTKAPQGSVADKAALGKIYECGIGTSKNVEQAKHWYQEALTNATGDEKNKIQARLSNLSGQSNTTSNGSCAMNYEPHFIVRFWKYFQK